MAAGGWGQVAARGVVAAGFGQPVLLLDEPTSHLDQATAGAVLEAVLEHARAL